MLEPDEPLDVDGVALEELLEELDLAGLADLPEEPDSERESVR